ncbi:hypothetical protein GQ43DRAFT_499790, partial [Delitschia confertaspora ATCC 74209]
MKDIFELRVCSRNTSIPPSNSTSNLQSHHDANKPKSDSSMPRTPSIPPWYQTPCPSLSLLPNLTPSSAP